MKMEVPIQITGRHLDITDAIRNDVNKKLQKLEKHFSHITRIHITLSVTGVDRRKIKKTDRPQVHTAKALVSLPHHDIVAEETRDDLYSSIDVLVDILDRKLIETKEKMQKRSDKITSELRHH